MNCPVCKAETSEGVGHSDGASYRCSTCGATWETSIDGAVYDVHRADALEQVHHPAHYGGEDNPYEAIKVIEAWDLGFRLGTVVKYIARAGKKDPAKHVEDLEKAKWYLEREIQQLRVE